MISTTDIAITINNEKIVLIKRKKFPFQDKYALPGGHVEEEDDSIASACIREAEEEINFICEAHELSLLMILDEKNRDPRPGRRISIVYHLDISDDSRIKNCQALSDAESIHILNLYNLSENDMAFDHWKVIKTLKNK